MKFTAADAAQKLLPGSEEFARLLVHGLADVGLYKPDKVDTQTPHTRDEVYVVISGTGEFLCGEGEDIFAPGDMFFVAAGVEHRFLNFSDDFCAWVVFFGERTAKAP